MVVAHTLEWSQTAILLLTSFCGSLLTAAVGVGGGTLVIMVMASIVPPLALIPVHGLVQLGSNATRAWLTRQHTDWSVIKYFACGAALSAVPSTALINILDTTLIPVLVAVFALWLLWAPLPKRITQPSNIGVGVGGFSTSLVSMLVGASGPLVAAWYGRSSADRWVYTANFSTSMSIQHSLKIAVFGYTGFIFQDWAILIVLMIAAGIIGTRVGLVLLGRLPEKLTKTLFKWLLTGLATQLIYRWWVHIA